jgi:hypothetical protein
MILKKLGLPPSVSTCIGQIWDATVHMIKTIYGTSTITYKNSAEKPLYGPGQGFTCGPTFWLIIYWLIVESIYPNMTTAKFLSACRAVFLEVFGTSFVDDTGLAVSSAYQWDPLLPSSEITICNINTVVSQLQALAQHWEWLLFSTGGAINLLKSFWYLMSWNWQTGIPRLLSTDKSPAQLQMTTGYATQADIVPRIDPHTSFRTLGVYISPSGCQKKQYEILGATPNNILITFALYF